jgi:DNA-binding MarR family transcriptional regulator
MLRLFLSNRPRLAAIAQEFDLAPMQLHALRTLEPGKELPMSALADSLACDASNVTGIVDRLEAHGLIERRGAPHDRRVKMLAVTEKGEEVRERLIRRMAEPPPTIAALSPRDQRALRDVLARALRA